MTQKSSVIINIIAVCLFLLASICGVYAIKEVTIQLGGSVSYQAVNPVNLSTQVTGAKYNGSANTLYVQSDGSINTNNNSFTIDGNCSSLTVNYGNVEFVQNSSGFTNIVTTFSFTNKKSTAICAKLSTDDFNPHPDITCIATDYMLKLNQNDTQTIEVTMGVLGTHATAPSLSTGTLKFTFEDFNVPTLEESGYRAGTIDSVNKTISLLGVPSGSGELDIPGYFYDSTNDCLLKVTKLDGDDTALKNIHGYSSVIVPNTVEDIDEYIFRGSYPKNVTLKKGLLRISLMVFKGSGIESIDIPNSVTSIDYEAFENCVSLTSVIIPRSVTSIVNFAFRGCTGLTSITIPDSVTSIGTYAFSGCTGLTSITIPRSVTSIGNFAFDGCTALDELKFSEGGTWQYSNSIGTIINTKTFNTTEDYSTFFKTSGTEGGKDYYWRKV